MIPETPSLAKFEFISVVSPRMRDAVEALFFFNPRQRRVREGIRVSVELFGHPKILEQDGKLWIGVRVCGGHGAGGQREQAGGTSGGNALQQTAT